MTSLCRHRLKKSFQTFQVRGIGSLRCEAEIIAISHILCHSLVERLVPATWCKGRHRVEAIAGVRMDDLLGSAKEGCKYLGPPR